MTICVNGWRCQAPDPWMSSSFVRSGVGVGGDHDTAGLFVYAEPEWVEAVYM